MSDIDEVQAPLDRPRSVAQHLAERLSELGVQHLFGVPGDFNLSLLDALLSTGKFSWHGSPNELNAGYAADGYARERGLGAVITTFGVGELSCINAAAGSFAESVPVVHIVGMPSRADIANHKLLHHTLLDGDLLHFRRAYEEFTAATEVLAPESAFAQVDTALTIAMTEHKPVYLGVPRDIVNTCPDTAAPSEPISPSSATAHSRNMFGDLVEERLACATSLTILVGNGIRGSNQRAAVAAIAKRLGAPIAVLLSGRGTVDESDPSYVGVYCGDVGDETASNAVENADLVLGFGVHLADSLSGMFTARLNSSRLINLCSNTSLVAGVPVSPLPVGTAMEVLEQLIISDGAGDHIDNGAIETPQPLLVFDGPDDTVINQDNLWETLGRWLPRDVNFVVDIGTVFYGFMSQRVSKNSRVTVQSIWNSIGYAIPAAHGQSLASPDRRVIAITGDGAAQMTAHEISAMARAGLSPIILLVNNDGYSIERAIQSPHALYNDLAPWDWIPLVKALSGTTPVLAVSCRTTSELRKALEAAREKADHLCFLEIRADKYDYPPFMRSYLNGGAKR
ncbi:hypothetical protein AWB85_19095 [Mycobacteroides immunogenum]|uniref:Alpha-keto-acid decarboxylase n=1 Tax=Mycobacteroides immunogenum TaxID=83262 RepID=A0A179VDN0_9MYCO|nr:thiamine pyrophosphate-binding protein [Mycobacteroides immunogenum]OAT69767.1 hypothetical protein AWB85_19095 [Mycobacteroides immunogenum]